MTRKCAVCTKSFTVRPNIGRKHRFCSSDCNQESYRLARRSKYETVATRACLFCAKEFEAAPTRVQGKLSQKFCTDACARSHRNASRRKGPSWQDTLRSRRQEAESFAAQIAPTEAAYFAGLIDGEGSVTIHLSDNRHASGTAYTEQVRMSIAMCHEPTVRRFHETFGGSFRRQKRNSKKWKDVYWCQQSGWRVYATLLAIFPFMITKREQARLAIEFQRIRKTIVGSRIEWHPRIAEQRRKYREAVRELNRRGPY